MNNKKRYLIFIGIITALVAGFIIFNNREEPNVASINQSHELVSSDIAEKPTLIQGSLFYIFESKNLVLTQADGSRKIIYQGSSKILDYYPSPSNSKVIVAIEKGDGSENYIVDVESGKAIKIEQCLAEAITWKDESTILANCFSQDYEYDPNTVNRIIYSDPDGKNQRKIVDLKFAPPRRIILTQPEKAIIVQNNSGYESNDLIELNTATGTTTKIFQNGFISDAKQAGAGQLLIQSEEFEFESEVQLLNLDTKSRTKIDTTSLRLTDYSNNRLAIVSNTDGQNLIISNISNPSKIIRKIDLSTLPEVSDIIFSGSEIYLFASDGIHKIDNI